jgi:beta-carotene 3-hydroxylase
MSFLIPFAITAGTFFFMEFMAWFTHKYVMHGFLWMLHEDHHVPHQGWFEKNDAFFLIFAIPSMACFIIGALSDYNFVFFIGLGILLYGLAYFFVHDIFIHQRFRWFRKTNNAYLMALRKAHKVHHKHLGKEQGECFGMLLVPFRYYSEAKKALNASNQQVE